MALEESGEADKKPPLDYASLATDAKATGAICDNAWFIIAGVWVGLMLAMIVGFLFLLAK